MTILYKLQNWLFWQTDTCFHVQNTQILRIPVGNVAVKTGNHIEKMLFAR